jgi:hypothetical protein
MNSKQFLKEGFIEDAHEAHMDHEVQMARVDCYYAAEHAIVLHKLLRNISEEQGLEGWVASKITLANDYLKSVREHLEYQMMNTDADEEDFLPLAEGLTSVKKKLSEAADSKDIQEFERGPWYIIVKGEVVPEDDGSPRKFNWLNAAKVFFRKMLDDDPTTAAQLKSEYDNATDKKSVVYYSKKLPSVSSDNSSLEESEKRPGLWANIRAKRERIKAGSGERMRKPGSKGAPTNKDLKSIRASSESMHEDGLNLDQQKSDFKNPLNLNLGSVRGLPINAGIQSTQTPQSYSNRPGATGMGLQPSLSIGNPESGPFAQISKQGGMIGYKKTFEGLGPEQKRVGQLGPTENVKKNSGARGKLVGANESVEQGVAEGSDSLRGTNEPKKKDAWGEGYWVGHRREDRDCPYPPGSFDAEMWELGYHEGNKDRKNEMTGRVAEGKWSHNAITGQKLDPRTGEILPVKEKPLTMKQMFAPKAQPKLTLDDVWRKVENVVSQIYPDGDPNDYMAPWLEKHGIRDFKIGEILDRAAKKNGYKDMYDYWNSMGEQGVAEGSEDLVQIEYWKQDSIEAGRWVKTQPMPREVAEELLHSHPGAFSRVEIVDVKQGVAEDIASTRREVNLKKKIDKGIATPEQKKEYQELKAKNMGRKLDKKQGVAEGYKEPTTAAGHAKMAAKIKKMLDDTLADRGDRHGNPDPQRLASAYEYHTQKAKEKSQGVAEGSLKEDEYDKYETGKMGQEEAVTAMFTRLARQGIDPIDMIANRFGWSTYELDDLAQQQGFKNTAEWLNSFDQGVAEGWKEKAAGAALAGAMAASPTHAGFGGELAGAVAQGLGRGVVSGAIGPKVFEERNKRDLEFAEQIPDEADKARYLKAVKKIMHSRNMSLGSNAMMGANAVDEIVFKKFKKKLSEKYNIPLTQVKEQGVAEGSNDLYQKAIRKYAQQVANDYLNGGNEYLYGANKFDAEMFGVSQEKANKDFKTWFTMIVRSQAVRPRRGVAEGSESKISKCASLAAKYFNSEGLQRQYDIDEYIKNNAGNDPIVNKCASLAAKYFNSEGLQRQYDIDEYIKANAKQGVAEGYSLKKTNVEKTFHPGDPEDFGSVDMTQKDTDYEIINNKTGQVVGTASWTTNDYFGPGAIKITMKNGATRYLDIKNSDKGNPQSAFNRFVKDPSTSKKYKEQGVAAGYVNDASEGTKFMIVYNKHHPNPAAHGKPVTGDGKPWIITATDRRAALDKAHEYFVRSQTVSSFRGYVDAVPVEQDVAEGFSDVVKGIKRKVAGKDNPKDVEHTYARIARRDIEDANKLNNQAAYDARDKSTKRWKKVNKVVNKQGAAGSKDKSEKKS